MNPALYLGDKKGDKKMVKNIAHRGGGCLAPENTIIGAQKGYEAGADLWETDVSITRDGHLILFHDDFLGRTTNADKVFPGRKTDLVADYTLSEIRMLDAGAAYIETDPFDQIKKGSIDKQDLLSFYGEKVPGLEDALLFTKNRNWKINLELKDQLGVDRNYPIPRRVLNAIAHVNMAEDQVVISSFRHSWLKQIRQAAPGIEIQALLGKEDTGPIDWGDFEFQVYNVNCMLIDKNQINRAKDKGKTINLFTVNDRNEMARWISSGVDGLFTDYPHVLADLIREDQVF
ncbi:MAG: glycerophosphodiester phosphodiesterase family protein [Desulfobacteraceae bacterium]